MASLKVTALSPDLPYGARITGVNATNVKDDAVRQELLAIFEDRGMIVFHDMEPSSDMQYAVSNVFGPPQVYALKEVPAVDNKPGVIKLKYDGNLVDANGRILEGWLPWHFDACYTEKLNRGGVLRAVDIPAEGGLTGFADGVQIYDAISPKLRAKFEDALIIYHSKLMFMHQRFGVPKNYKWLSVAEVSLKLIENSEAAPRAVHPAIWQRKSGEKVLHVSPWQAVGIYGHDNAEGDALLEELCQEINSKAKAYWHAWQPMDMIIWDNWRFIHGASGNDPKYARSMQRTTITGDYGLGRFERDAAAIAQRAV
jgi:taurine dioxygenase